ncbi:rod shape-determining protein MreC [Haloferula sp. A504]|jgi:rod shape-determining protein MreC|uniref:rod shape-determining protein MreC n=1 Tax=Haloferula sp. A504 TaxID=3373601 RepID=UPI0031BE0D8D|nr:rod shape-determining protein MreC [Verrucomicrobiaceae bacterium E54]
MKPLNLLALLVFLAGLTWALTRSERSVREIQATYYRAISPFLTVGSSLEARARAFLDEVEHSKLLEAEVGAMRDDYGRLKLIESQFRKVEEENAALRRALDFQERTRFEVVAARVTRRQPTTWWQTVEIDRGEASGIATAYTVVTDQGLVGKIDRLGDQRSTVLLLTDEACQVSAKVEGSPEVGILQGQREQFGGVPTLRLRFLSRDARLREGMRVFSTGRGGLFPADLLLGEIDRLEPGPLASEALVRPSVDFQNLGTVFVLTPQKEES